MEDEKQLSPRNVQALELRLERIEHDVRRISTALLGELGGTCETGLLLRCELRGQKSLQIERILDIIAKDVEALKAEHWKRVGWVAGVTGAILAAWEVLKTVINK